MTDVFRPRRRPRAVGALALFAVVAVVLSGCQTQSGAAAFVAGQRTSQQQVDTVAKGTHGKIADGNPTDTRRDYLVNLIMAQVGQKLLVAKHLKVPSVDYQAAASTIGLPANNTFVRAEAQGQAYLTALAKAVGSPQLTEKLVREQDKELKEAGVIDPKLPIEELAQFLSQPGVEPVMSLWSELYQAQKTYGVKVNPRYGTVAYPLPVPGIQQPLPVPLGGPPPQIVVSPSSTASPQPQG